jgi:hypothetical protein
MFVIHCPECEAEMKSKSAPPAGKKIRCKECSIGFVPKDIQEIPDETKPVAASPTATGRKVDDDEDANPYGVTEEVDTDAQKEAKAKVRFDGVDDRKKRSARGPAMSLLVMPSNLLVAEGGITFLIGMLIGVMGLWPLVFTEVEPSDDDYMEQGVWILFGLMMCAWGTLIILGASRMQNLESYTWAMTGAVLGILPLLAGIYAIIALRNPKVVAGFEEVEGALDENEDEYDKEKKDDDDDDDEEEEEEEVKPKKKKR